jgi:hypothetical protein
VLVAQLDISKVSNSVDYSQSQQINVYNYMLFSHID